MNEQIHINKPKPSYKLYRHFPFSMITYKCSSALIGLWFDILDISWRLLHHTI